MVLNRLNRWLYFSVSLALLTFTSCTFDNKETTDYLIIIDNKDLSNTDRDFNEKITLNVDKDKCQDFKLPSLKSNLVIVKNDDSIAVIPIYQYNFFERIAGSRPTTARYSREINKRLGEKPLFNSQKDTIQKLIIHSDYYALTGAGIHPYLETGKTKSFASSSVADFYKSLCSLQDQEFIILDFTSNIPEERFNVGDAKVETYNTMRRFYENMEILYENISNSQAKTESIELIKKLFASPDSYIEIRNNNGPVERYTVQEFLSRITSNNRYQYEDVSMFMRNFRFLKEFEETNSGDIPNNYPAEITYDQIFKGVSNGKIKY